jgi:hypothetical protein
MMNLVEWRDVVNIVLGKVVVASLVGCGSTQEPTTSALALLVVANSPPCKSAVLSAVMHICACHAIFLCPAKSTTTTTTTTTTERRDHMQQAAAHT